MEFVHFNIGMFKMRVGNDAERLIRFGEYVERAVKKAEKNIMNTF